MSYGPENKPGCQEDTTIRSAVHSLVWALTQPWSPLRASVIVGNENQVQGQLQKGNALSWAPLLRPFLRPFRGIGEDTLKRHVALSQNLGSSQPHLHPQEPSYI